MALYNDAQLFSASGVFRLEVAAVQTGTVVGDAPYRIGSWASEGGRSERQSGLDLDRRGQAVMFQYSLELSQTHTEVLDGGSRLQRNSGAPG